ncbi:hypothetical protein M8818_005041 [Zalaria obscura]|uniref:Uncharacterized protein n=1 Tax=Zalaria obscura TaxID=2024903 RepID=A0ACC3SAF6_9PEZI
MSIYGGIHSGCAVAAITWYLAYVGALTRDFYKGLSPNLAEMVLGWMIFALLASVCIFAHPYIRRNYHDFFELVHRIGGWASILLFWLQLIASAYSRTTPTSPMAAILAHTPIFWLLISTTLLIAYPWLRLRLRTVRAELLSPHALRLHFPYGRRRICETIRLSTSPLLETHAFACIPARDSARGFSVVISNAGDWTNRIISNAPDRIWTRGVPTVGMLHVALAFRKIVLVTTGSGIGPCLSIFAGRPDYSARIIWSTRSPIRTYGKAVVGAVLEADADAVIVDTEKDGRPDLVRLAYALYCESGAEAVLVMSNAVVTGLVVGEMKRRGVRAFAPIFDS